MARARAAIDPLFEFDAPQTFTDLSAPLSPFAAGDHDVWFDQIHPQHSEPSAELAKELAETARKLQEQEQLKELKSKSKNRTRRGHGWSLGKENELPSVRNQQLKQNEKKYTSLKEMRATQEPFQLQQLKTETKPLERRRPLVDVGNRLSASVNKKRPLPSAEKKEIKSLQELLKRHNKKFKASHTYEPPQHSVREVKQWEREMKKSYYALSAEERVQANQEIAVWKQRRQVERGH